MKKILAIALLSFSLHGFAQVQTPSPARPVAQPKINYVVVGRDFVKYKNPKRKTPKVGQNIEVLYFYYYGSPWAAKIDGDLRRWAATRPYNIVFRPVPVYFNQNPAGIFATRIHYALESLGEEQRLSPLFVQAVQKGSVNLLSAKSVISWMENHGVEEKNFLKHLNAPRTKFLTTSTPFALAQYEITSVPTIVIDGQYIISANQNRSPEKTVAIAEFMVDKLVLGGPRP